MPSSGGGKSCYPFAPGWVGVNDGVAGYGLTVCDRWRTRFTARHGVTKADSAGI